MSRKGFKSIDGIRLKIRDDENDLVAHIWIDGEKLEHGEVLRAPMKFIGPPGSSWHHLFTDTATALFNAWLGSTLGVEGIRSFRQKPNYKGE